MNNSQKTVYLIAVIAIIILILNVVYTNRFYNGVNLRKNAMISLNTEDGHGVSITQDSRLVSFESGFVYELSVTDFPDPEQSVISVALPIKNLKPDTTYSSVMRFRMQTNTEQPISIKTNSKISMEQTSFETDVNFKPVTINDGSDEYVIDLDFETNEDGDGFVIFDFKVDDSLDTLNVSLSNLIISEFKEIEDASINTEQESETVIEIV
ncbi:hypothetical protein R2F61_08820 [Mollicutes bacterium LVI A0078]|nr:hypothetical protein RZE84_08595 [Mollicutes bacterium LVI A0075]WOO90802.1 hypothetical protein R2F61_08820 [Mollicutes bacterium LVI A0078]